VPLRIIREPIAEGRQEEAGARASERERKRKRARERKQEARKGRGTEKRRGSWCYFVQLFDYFLSFREGPKKSSHAARERDPEHALRHARTHARTHALLRGNRERAACEGS